MRALRSTFLAAMRAASASTAANCSALFASLAGVEAAEEAAASTAAFCTSVFEMALGLVGGPGRFLPALPLLPAVAE